MPTARRTEWQLGRAVGNYALEGLVARGGMGEVWLARAQDGRRVIIKRVIDALHDDDSTFDQMLLDEARIAAQLNHPNIVQLLDLGREGDGAFLVLEYLKGENLSVLIRTAKKQGIAVPRGVVVAVAAQLARALDYAHTKTDMSGLPLSLVHRDVTPQNVIITYDGVAKLIDFGIAKATGRSTTTSAGLVKGKLTYMSPEQARGEAIDGRSDLFSLGVLMFELLSATRFQPPELDDLALFRRLAAGGPFPRVLDRVPDLEPHVARVVDRALAPNVADRYPDAATLRDELEALLPRFDGTTGPALAEWVSGLIPPTKVETAPAAIDSDEWFSNVPALDSEGHLVAPPQPLLATPAPAPAFSVRENGEGPLELAPQQRYGDEPKTTPGPEPEHADALSKRPSSVWPLTLVVLLGVLVTGGYFGWKRMATEHAGTHGTLVILTQPAGAAVHIGGSVVGRTPYASDNLWRGVTHVELTLPGYERYESTFEGGEPVELHASLRAAPHHR